MTNEISEQAKDIIEDIREDIEPTTLGELRRAGMAALEDGAFLAKMGWCDADVIDEAYRALEDGNLDFLEL